MEVTNVLIPWYPVSYLTIASSGFSWGGRLRVPTRRCDLVVPADWGWGRLIKQGFVIVTFLHLPNGICELVYAKSIIKLATGIFKGTIRFLCKQPSQ